jgi:hypothetical protein
VAEEEEEEIPQIQAHDGIEIGDDIGKQQQHFDQKAPQHQINAIEGGGTQQQKENAVPDENAGAGGEFLHGCCI